MSEVRSIAGELGARVDEHDRAEEHADLADDVEGQQPHRGQPHCEVDQEEGESGDQPQGQQIEGTVLSNALVDRGDARAELRLDPVAQHVARREEGQARADRRRERDDRDAEPQAEDRARCERHDRRARQRQRGDRDIEQEEAADHRQRSTLDQGGELGLARFQGFQGEILAEVEQEEGGDRGGDQRQQDDLARIRLHLAPLRLCLAQRARRRKAAGSPLAFRLEGARRRDAIATAA